MRVSQSFINGMLSISMVQGQSPRRSNYQNGLSNDKVAMQGDWRNVGNDIRRGISRNSEQR